MKVSLGTPAMTDTQKAAQVRKMQLAEAVKKVKAETLIYENEIKKQINGQKQTRNFVCRKEDD